MVFTKPKAVDVLGSMYVNARTMMFKKTGVQRYTSSIMKLIGDRVVSVCPNKELHGLRGHVWEQTVLPNKTREGLLWSPANTGPLSHSRQVVTIHDMAVFDHPEWFNPKFVLWYRMLLKKLANRVVSVITVSEFSKQRIVYYTRIQPERVHVIYAGVEPEFKPGDNEQVHACLKRHGVRGPYLLFVGSVEPRKNLYRLIYAWGQVPRHLKSDMSLLVVGGMGQAFRDVGLKELPKDVKMLGHVCDVDLPLLYSGAMAFLYPSLYEGFGLPPLEAMACGTPVVTSHTTAIPEAVGESALLVDPEDVSSIASSIIRVLQDSELRRKLRENGLKRASEFSWSRTASQTLEILSEASD